MQLRILPRSGAGGGDEAEGKGGELFRTFLMSWKYMMSVTYLKSSMDKERNDTIVYTFLVSVSFPHPLI